MKLTHIFLWSNFTFLVISETLKQRDGFWYITGRGCGITTPIKYLSEIPEDIENYGCSIIRPKVQHIGNVSEFEEKVIANCDLRDVGIDYDSEEKHNDVADAYDCARKCREHENCQFFTYVADLDGFCALR